MTDTTTTKPEEEPSENTHASVSRGPTGNGAPGGLDSANLTRNLQWGGLLVLVVAALVTTVRFYTSTTRAIQVWVGPGFQPLFMAAFNLAVLSFSVAGISLLARRLQGHPANG